MIELKKGMIIILGYGVTGHDVLISLDKFKEKIIIVDDKIKPEDKEFIYSKSVLILSSKELLSENYDVNVIVKSPGIKFDHPVIIRYNDVKIINDIEMSYYLTKNTNVKIIAVTGTNGKTSTTTFITTLLKNAGYNAFSCGNIGVSPLKILRENNNIDFLVMELSSFQLKTIDKFKPYYAFFLNFHPDHLDYHSDLEDYNKSKLNIIKNGTTSGYFFVNTDINVVANELTLLKNDFNLELTTVNRGINLENLKLVFQMCKIQKISYEIFKDTLENKYQPLEHRIEFIRDLDGVRYYNDSKGTNVSATIEALKQLKNIILLVGGKDKGEDMNSLLQNFNTVKSVVAYGENRDKFDFIDNLIKVHDLKSALNIAKGIAKKGDCILLSPASASYDQFSNFEERGNVFKNLVNGMES